MAVPVHSNSAGQSVEGEWSDPATAFAAITPHATNPISPIPRALFVGTGGNITMKGENDSADVVLKNVPSGAIVPVSPKYIRAIGTTATDIVALN